MPFGDEIFQFEPVPLAQGVVHDYQLDLHFLRQDVFDVDAHGLPGMQVGAALGEAREVGRDLDEGAVFLHAPHDAHHRLTFPLPQSLFRSFCHQHIENTTQGTDILILQALLLLDNNQHYRHVP